MATKAELQQLADKVHALPPASRLLLAAGLIEKGPDNYQMAESIIRNVADEIKLVLMLKAHK